jgi:hypothetical protein
MYYYLRAVHCLRKTATWHKPNCGWNKYINLYINFHMEIPRDWTWAQLIKDEGRIM